MYAGDSFFTLSGWEQAGLIALSLTLALAALIALLRVTDGRGRWVRIVLALLALWLWDWLTPQLYYLYYQALIPGLPWQVVVRWPPPGPLRMAELLSFSGRESLADHARGILGWLMILIAAFRR